MAPARRGLRCRFRPEVADFSYWSTVTARRHHMRGGEPVPDLADLRLRLRPGVRGDALRDAHRLEEAITHAHLGDVPTVGPANLDAEDVDDRAVTAELRSQALFGRGGKIRSRRQARRLAIRATADVAGARRRRAATYQDADRLEADTAWDALVANEPAAVLGALEATFDLDDVPAAPVACAGETVTVIVSEPAADAIPDHKVSRSRRGRLTLTDRSEAEQAELALRLAASHVLAVVLRVAAAAPGIRDVRVLAVRPVPGRREVEAVYAGGFDVEDAERWLDPDVDAVAEVRSAREGLLASTEGLRPLDLTDEPDIDRVVKEVGAALYPVRA